MALWYASAGFDGSQSDPYLALWYAGADCDCSQSDPQVALWYASDGHQLLPGRTSYGYRLLARTLSSIVNVVRASIICIGMGSKFQPFTASYSDQNIFLRKVSPISGQDAIVG